MNLEQRMDVDCVWKVQTPEKERTHLIVYHQQEHGCATGMVGKALIGDAEPIACIFSKLMETDTFNHIPSPAWTEYRLYETRSNNGDRFWILRIPKAYPVELHPVPTTSNMSWLYTYPIVRDIVLILNQYGVNGLTYMTTNLFALRKGFEQYGNLPHGHVATFDFATMEKEVSVHFGSDEAVHGDDFILAPNVWIWCSVFSHFCFDCKRAEVLLGSPSPTFVDVDCADSLLNHLQITFDLPYDQEVLTSFTNSLRIMADETYVKIDLEDEQDDFDMGDFKP